METFFSDDGTASGTKLPPNSVVAPTFVAMKIPIIAIEM
jgi:hypothetical protein